MRWNEDDPGAVSPGEFIPVAEMAATIGIGDLALRTALDDATQWKSPGYYFHRPMPADRSPVRRRGVVVRLLHCPAEPELVPAIS